jgi:hypothetical protein
MPSCPGSRSTPAVASARSGRAAGVIRARPAGAARSPTAMAHRTSRAAAASSADVSRRMVVAHPAAAARASVPGKSATTGIGQWPRS